MSETKKKTPKKIPSTRQIKNLEEEWQRQERSWKRERAIKGEKREEIMEQIGGKFDGRQELYGCYGALNVLAVLNGED